jgi:hypothetical protein
MLTVLANPYVRVCYDLDALNSVMSDFRQLTPALLIL